MKKKNEWKEEQEKENYKASLKKQIDNIETILEGESELGNKDPSWTQKLLTKVIDNIQIELSNVQIVFKNDFCFEGYDILLGISLHNMKAITTNKDQVFSYVENSDIFRKFISIQHFSIFLKVTEDKNEFQNFNSSTFQSQLFSEMFLHQLNSAKDSEFILKDFNFNLKFHYNRNDSTNS